MSQTLHQRLKKYEEAYDTFIINKIPVIVKLNGRLFSAVTENIQKPFCQKTRYLFNLTMLELAKQIEGVVLIYGYSDKIFLVLRNDQTSENGDAWFGNKVQTLSSITSSVATYKFMTSLLGMGSEGPNLEGSLTFAGFSFGIPTITEVINYLIYQQHICQQTAINESVFYLLQNKFNQHTFAMIKSKTMEEKISILSDSNFNFDQIPLSYRFGALVYKIPELIRTENGQRTKHRWVIDNDIPLISDSKEFIRTIITTGSDIFRPERDLKNEVKG